LNLLLDTHCLLWWLAADPRLSDAARAAIAEPEHTTFLSAVVLWEIRIKQALGKLDLPEGFREAVDEQRFAELPITLDHADAVGALPLHHRDPFDRMLVVQAQLSGLTIVTQDERIHAYDVAVLG